MRPAHILFAAFGVVMAAPLSAEWIAANAEVREAVKDPRISAALAAVNRIDAALIADDRAVFAETMAPELAVNNPGNIVTRREATVRRNRDGHIRYTRYQRTIEHASRRGDMVLLMGEERVVPMPSNPLAGREVRRRFTDLWREEGGRWMVSARQATVIAPSR